MPPKTVLPPIMIIGVFPPTLPRVIFKVAPSATLKLALLAGEKLVAAKAIGA